MALAQGFFVLGSHAYFFRNGDAFTVPSSGTAGRSSKPGATDTGWIDMGILEAASIAGESEDIDIFAPAPGQKRLYDRIPIKRQLTVKFTCKELGPIHMEHVLQSLALTAASTQLNPLEGAVSKNKGWLKLQAYDQTDSARLTIDLFVYLKVANELDMSGNGLVEVQFEADVLHSIYNTGTL